jgi:sulfatase maturation enzyme AslB (radical SAM superfamily)
MNANIMHCNSIDLNKNKSFCILPFIHLHVNENDSLKPCCFATKLDKKYSQEFDFYADVEFTNIRTKMLNGEPIPQCTNCYNIEKNNLQSFRIRDTTEWLEKLNIKNFDEVIPNLIYYDIRNDNLCNLSCRMCHPGASSQLEKEYTQLGWSILPASRRSQLSEIVNYDTIQQLYIAGGEPTLMPEFKKFLKKAIEYNRTDIHLRIITNGTNVNREILSLLKNFKTIDITVSLDGYDQVNRYIRWPSDWDTIDKNIDKLKSLTHNISFNATVSIWNITSISKLVKYLESKFDHPTIFLNEVMRSGKINFSAANFPNKQLALDDLTLLKNTRTYQNEYYFKDKVDYLITQMQNTQVNIKDLQDFFDYNDALDKSRNIKLQDYIPELEECKHWILQ